MIDNKRQYKVDQDRAVGTVQKQTEVGLVNDRQNLEPIMQSVMAAVTFEGGNC